MFSYMKLQTKYLYNVRGCYLLDFTNRSVYASSSGNQYREFRHSVTPSSGLARGLSSGSFRTRTPRSRGTPFAGSSSTPSANKDVASVIVGKLYFVG